MNAQEHAAIQRFLATHKVTKLPTVGRRPRQRIHVRRRTRMLGQGWISQQLRDKKGA